MMQEKPMWGVRCDWFMTLSKVSWSDGNSIMSHYLSLLSTELWLLKNNGQDYSTSYIMQCWKLRGWICITLKTNYYEVCGFNRFCNYVFI